MPSLHKQAAPEVRERTGDATTASRRAVLAGVAAMFATPRLALAAPAASWEIGTQILAGTRVKDPVFLAMALQALGREVGTATLDALLDAVLARDAANIGEPFADPAVEAAARRFVDIVFTGEVPGPEGPQALGYHQALAWQVLSFTKPPSVCGPGFGWWTDPPEEG